MCGKLFFYEPLVDEAVKATVAALVTPTPPMPQAQSSPEAVARAFMEAIAAGKCDEAERYMSPDARRKLELWCGTDPNQCFVGQQIEEVLVRPLDALSSWSGNSEAREAVLVGRFDVIGRSGPGQRFSCDDLRSVRSTDDARTRETVSIEVEPLEGKWYVYYLE